PCCSWSCDEVTTALSRGQHDVDSHPLGGLDLRQQLSVLDAGVGPAAVGQVAHRQAPLGRPVPAVGDGGGGGGGGAGRGGGGRHRRVGGGDPLLQSGQVGHLERAGL